MPEFYMILARKIITIPEFLTEKCPNFTQNLPENIFFRISGGTCPLPPVSYAYAPCDSYNTQSCDLLLCSRTV